jgi:hypothetical protein
MTFLGNRLLLVAGPVKQEQARFDLFRFDPGTEKLELLTPNGFPNVVYDRSGGAANKEREFKVEGLAALDDGLLILLDSGEWGDDGALDVPAHYYLLDIANGE